MSVDGRQILTHKKREEEWRKSGERGEKGQKKRPEKRDEDSGGDNYVA